MLMLSYWISEVITLTYQDRINSVKQSQYHGCGYPGSARRQAISSYDIDYVEWVGHGITWGHI